jgi:hypothetical protein
MEISIKILFYKIQQYCGVCKKEGTILARYFRFGVEIERKHIHNTCRKGSLNVKEYKHGDDVKL